MKHDFNLPRSELEHLIDEWIYKEKYRSILKDRLLDGMTYEALAEKYGMSDRQMKRIVYKAEDIFFSHK